MEEIIGHRFIRKDNKENLELKIKWKGYKETTWEIFADFARDTAPLVERYLLKNSLLKPLENLNEIRRLKKLGKKANDPEMHALIKSVRKSFPEIDAITKMASNTSNISN